MCFQRWNFSPIFLVFIIFFSERPSLLMLMIDLPKLITIKVGSGGLRGGAGHRIWLPSTVHLMVSSFFKSNTVFLWTVLFPPTNEPQDITPPPPFLRSFLLTFTCDFLSTNLRYRWQSLNRLFGHLRSTSKIRLRRLNKQIYNCAKTYFTHIINIISSGAASERQTERERKNLSLSVAWRRSLGPYPEFCFWKGNPVLRGAFLVDRHRYPFLGAPL